MLAAIFPSSAGMGKDGGAGSGASDDERVSRAIKYENRKRQSGFHTSADQATTIFIRYGERKCPASRSQKVAVARISGDRAIYFVSPCFSSLTAQTIDGPLYSVRIARRAADIW